MGTRVDIRFRIWTQQGDDLMEENRTPTGRFQHVELWHHAHRLVLGIYELSRTLPEEERLGLVSQMRRTAVAVPAAIVDSCRGGAAPMDRIAVERALAKLEELRYVLMLCRDLGFDLNYGRVEGESEQLANLLAALEPSAG